MTTLRPTHYLYLKNPFFSDGVEMIKTTLQELCLLGALKLDVRWVNVDRRYNRQRKRYFFVPGPNFQSYKTGFEAENFLLDPFSNYSELGFAHLKHYLKNHFGKNIDDFKKKFVKKDVISIGLINSLHFPSSIGKQLRNDIKNRLSFINSHIDDLVLQPLKLKIELEAIGMAIILLKKETLEKIRGVNQDILDIGLLKLITDTSTDSYYYSFMYFSAFDSFSSFDFADSIGGFDGMGGDSGGGGASGDW